MENLNPANLLDKLTQNDIDFLCKTFQIWHDFFFGSDNDDATLEQIQPFTCSLRASYRDDVRNFGGSRHWIGSKYSDYGYFLYDYNFDGYESHFSDLQAVYNPLLTDLVHNDNDATNLGLYMADCDSTASYITIDSSRLDSNQTPFYSDRCVAGKVTNSANGNIALCSYSNINLMYYTQNATAKKFYDIFRTTIYNGYSSTYIRDQSTLVIDMQGEPATFAPSMPTGNQFTGLYQNWGTNATGSAGWYIKPFAGSGSCVMIVPSGRVSQDYTNIYNDNSTYNNTYNYTTNEGDTITTYYGDNYISIELPIDINTGIVVPVAYIDIESILDHIIDDLNINGDITDVDGNKLELSVPTFEEIKYQDVGDFNITPVEQLRQLPVAPSFEVNLDVGDLPDTIGYSVTEYLDIADAVLGVGGSALLLGALFFSFLWLKIKRR